MSKKTTPVKPVPLASAASAKRLGMSLHRCQMLACNLGVAAVRLSRGRRHDVPGEHLDDYLRLGSLSWEAEGGRLLLTPDSAAVCSTAA